MSRSPVFASFGEALNGVQTGLNQVWIWLNIGIFTCVCISINHAGVYLIPPASPQTSAPVPSSFALDLFNASQPQLSVRAFRQVERFSKDNEKKLIVNLSCYLNQGAVQLWLGLRLNWITTAILSVVAIFCVVQHQLGFSFSVRL